MTKGIAIPVFVGIVLYSDQDALTVKYILTAIVIISCYTFMTVINRLPKVGLYTHMLNKVRTYIYTFSFRISIMLFILLIIWVRK